jgi:hypothetical protein
MTLHSDYAAEVLKDVWLPRVHHWHAHIKAKEVALNLIKSANDGRGLPEDVYREVLDYVMKWPTRETRTRKPAVFTHQRSVYLSEEQFRMVDREAARRGVEPGTWIRQAIDEKLERITT